MEGILNINAVKLEDACGYWRLTKRSTERYSVSGNKVGVFSVMQRFVFDDVVCYMNNGDVFCFSYKRKKNLVILVVRGPEFNKYQANYTPKFETETSKVALESKSKSEIQK